MHQSENIKIKLITIINKDEYSWLILLYARVNEKRQDARVNDKRQDDNDINKEPGYCLKHRMKKMASAILAIKVEKCRHLKADIRHI